MGDLATLGQQRNALKRLSELDDLRKRTTQTGGQIQHLASVYLQIRADAEDQADIEFLDNSLGEVTASVKASMDSLPAADRATIHNVLNQIFGSTLETNPANL